MSDEELYGASPKHGIKKSCLDCAYLQLKKHSYREYSGDYIWYGEMADCHHKTWERGCSYALNDALQNITRLDNCPPDEEGIYSLPLKPSDIKDLLGVEYGLTRIPTPDEKFIELADFTCRRFFPKEELNQRTLKACWQDQQEVQRKREDWIKFGIPTSIALFALAISALSLWVVWE